MKSSGTIQVLFFLHLYDSFDFVNASLASLVVLIYIFYLCE